MLDGVGVSCRDDAVCDLTKAIAQLEQAMNALGECKGIGTEFCIEKIETLKDTVQNYRDAVRSIPGGG
jgi:hypothetical protein